MSLNINEQYFISKIDQATDDFISKQAVAPTRSGWDPIFRKRIESKSQLKRAWMGTVQDIVSVASAYGYDLSSRIGNVEEE